MSFAIINNKKKKEDEVKNMEIRWLICLLSTNYVLFHEPKKAIVGKDLI